MVAVAVAGRGLGPRPQAGNVKIIIHHIFSFDFRFWAFGNLVRVSEIMPLRRLLFSFSCGSLAIAWAQGLAILLLVVVGANCACPPQQIVPVVPVSCP